jgi:ubiquinol-cytochrome c reductase cytochrome c1 subunit
MTTRAIAWVLAALLAGAAGLASAAGGADVRLSPAPVNRLDEESLQRGARNFVNYCLSCHTAKYMRYNRLTDLGLTEAQITDNLMFASDKIGSTMTVAMTEKDAKAWFGAAPPDLSVESRIRGRDWLYNYLLGFYRDDKSASGWNNLVFPNVGMPHVLWQLSGVNKLVQTEYEDHEKATAAAIAIKGLSAVEPLQGHKYAVLQSVADVPGSMTRVQYESFVADLVNYMDYMAEPVKNRRIHLGILVLLFLGVLFVFAYALKREYWKDLH